MKFPNIKLYRQAYNYSQEDIAKALRINIMTYSNRELGKREFTASNIVTLSELYKCSTDDLLVKKVIDVVIEILKKEENV